MIVFFLSVCYLLYKSALSNGQVTVLDFSACYTSSCSCALDPSNYLKISLYWQNVYYNVKYCITNWTLYHYVLKLIVS